MSLAHHSYSIKYRQKLVYLSAKLAFCDTYCLAISCLKAYLGLHFQETPFSFFGEVTLVKRLHQSICLFTVKQRLVGFHRDLLLEPIHLPEVDYSQTYRINLGFLNQCCSHFSYKNFGQFLQIFLHFYFNGHYINQVS